MPTPYTRFPDTPGCFSSLIWTKEELDFLYHMVFLSKELGEFSDKYYKIMSFRRGLDDGDGIKTLEETGQRFGVTRERIRQIEAMVNERVRESRDKFITS